MKKIFFIYILCVGILSGGLVVHAQSSSTSTTGIAADPTRQCDTIYSFNYNFCCGTFRSQNQLKCDAADLERTTVTSGTPQTTRPLATQEQLGTAPATGAPELKQCSAIRFVSLLDILIWVKCIINTAIIPMLFSLALVFFLWGVGKFMRASDSTKREEGKKIIISGLIGLFVMTSLWGIVKIVSNIFGTGSTVPLLQSSPLSSKKTP